MKNIFLPDIRNKMLDEKFPDEVKQQLEKIKQIQDEKELAVQSDRYDLAARLRDDELKVWKEVVKITMEKGIDISDLIDLRF